MSATDSNLPSDSAAHVGCPSVSGSASWVKRGKVWVDLYHPDTYQLRDHSKHSRKQKRERDEKAN